MSVAIQPRVEEEPSATMMSGWFAAKAVRVCGSNGTGIGATAGQSSALAPAAYNRRRRKAFFLEKKKQKTLEYFGFGLSG
jgi:hypothetical protein